MTVAHNAKDLSGQRFGRLTVIKRTESMVTSNGRKYAVFECQCDCGRIKNILARALHDGGTISCGCLKLEKASLRGKNGDLTTKKHGESKSRLYNVWSGMRQRTSDPNHHSYKNYGGRGITVCAEWDDFSVFRDWALANGYDENAPQGKCTIDRIDNDRGYSPDNCRWVSNEVQAANKRPRTQR